ncbi:MAG: hypothetical protein WDN46_04635 [Methylocella sp.]
MIAEAALIVHLAGFLCDSEPNAIRFAERLAEALVEDIAANDVGRVAGKQVCGFYSGDATVLSEKRVVFEDYLYLVTEYVFTKDKRMAVAAERTFDVEGNIHENPL